MRKTLFSAFCITLITLVFVSASSSLAAEVLRVGVVLPFKENGARAAVLQASIEAALADLEGEGLGLSLYSKDAADDDAFRALLQDAQVHAIICCTSRAALEHAARASAGRVPILSLSSEVVPKQYVYSLGPSVRQTLTFLATATSLEPVGLLAPKDPFGALAARVLSGAAVVRYAPDAAPLTPEALEIATQEPHTVVVWDAPKGALEAVNALHARGYTGRVIVPAATFDALDAINLAKLTGSQSVVSPAVLGFTLSDTHPSKKRLASYLRSLRDVPQSFRTPAALTLGASLYDALHILGSSLTQIMVYTPELRGAEFGRALRSNLAGLGELAGAGGSYIFSKTSGPVLDPGSLVLANWYAGAFRSAP